MKKISFIEFSAALKKTTNLDDLNKKLAEFLAGYSIKSYSFTYYSYYPNSLNKIKYDYATPDFTHWHQHYLSEHYEEIDSTLDEVQQNVVPIFWNLQQQLKEAKGARERQMRLDSIHFGVVQGLSIPIHGPQEEFATLTLVQMKKQSCLDNYSTIQHELFCAAYHYFHYLQQHLLYRPQKKYTLKPRELQCLTLIAKNYSTETIAKMLKITPRTVNFHIQRLNKKLGTNNKYQSVIKALTAKIINI